MDTGANFQVNAQGHVLWYKPLISGDDLLVQDHEARVNAKQRTYIPHPQYGNPYAATLTREISETERDMLLPENMKECTLQDTRFIDCIVNKSSIEVEGQKQSFDYTVVKKDGTELQRSFSSDT
ncbi:MAG: hypothetical protein GY866_00635 [Proteobacteria bacterium]|nr:hypothetical protein [Pseudomonadota bacterium]